jgi:DNA-binding LacI/PurR family transcriptional regulator
MLTKYHLIHQELLRGLRSGRWQAGEQLPALPDLARQLGASRWATDRALHMLIAEGLLERVPKQGTFVREATLRGAYQRAPITVLGVSPSDWLAGDYLGPMMGTFAADLGERDWVFLHLTDPDAATDRLQSFGSPIVISINPRKDDVPALERLASAGLQVLCLGANVESSRLHSVAMDNMQAMQIGLHTLAQLGHRRVGFLGTFTAAFDTIDRELGFRQGVAALGLDPDPRLVVCRTHPEGVAALVEEAFTCWWSLPEPPTAIFSGGVALTHPLLEALATRALRVPDDVSLVAIDDSPLLAHLATPVTVIRQPLEEMGHRAAQVLELLVGHAGSAFHVLVPPTLIERASCAARNEA